ncbi:hypothetical protein JCM10450v2_007973 [Rhodotorula kratochvilovae]
MSTRTASRTASTASTATSNPSPRKAARAPRTVILDDSSSDLLDSAHLDAIRADFDLEAASYLRALAKKHDERIKAVQRCFHDSLAALDDQVRALSLDRFVSEFGADPARAIKGLVGEKMRPAPMSQVEQSVRKRKRVQALSPRTTLDDYDTDVFSTSKKARSASAAPGALFSSAAKGKKPASVARSASTRSKRGGMSPTSARKPRLRLRPSTAASTAAAASSNFIYRTNPHLPPTPGPSAPTAGAMGTARRPKRGESIVMRSMNGSPLGEFVASEEDDDDEGESEEEGEEEEDEGEDEWDLLERNEASKVEHQSASKRRGGKGAAGAGAGAGKLTKPPSAASFAVALPAGAPSFEALKARWTEEMRARLRKADVSEAERRRLEEVLMASMTDL